MRLLTLGLIWLAGCTGETPPPLTTSPPGRVQYVTHCLKCGREKTGISDRRSDEGRVVQVEWCEEDGRMCSDGWQLILKRDDKALLAHCRECDGCKMTLYTPWRWKKVNGE